MSKYRCHSHENRLACLLLTDPVVNRRLRTVMESDGVVIADGGRARDGQRSLDDARWSPRQQRLDELEEGEQ